MVHHYRQHKKENAMLLEKINDNEIRALLGLRPIEVNLNMKCEICKVFIDSEDMYFVHLIEYHNVNEIMNSVTNEKVLNFLIENNFLSGKCELCNDYLKEEFTRENYLNHLKTTHKSELNFKLLKKIRDYKVLVDILVNSPKENKTRLKLRVNGEVVKNNFEGDDFLEEIYRQRRDAEEDGNLKCEVCQCKVERYLEDYIAHLFDHSFAFTPEWTMYEHVSEIFIEANYFNFKCEICSFNVGLKSNYFKHLNEQHFQMGMELIKHVNDYFLLAMALRKYLIKKKMQNLREGNLNNSSISSQIQRNNLQNNNMININESILSQELNSTKFNSNVLSTLSSLNNSFIEEKRICDICKKEVEPSYELYAYHIISEHSRDEIYNARAIPHYVLYILSDGVIIPITCELCGTTLTEEVKDYISHISNSHSTMIKNDLNLKIKDKYVVDSLLKKNNLLGVSQDLSNLSLRSTQSNNPNIMVLSYQDNLSHLLKNNSQGSNVNTSFSNKSSSSFINPVYNSNVFNDKNEKLIKDKKVILEQLRELNDSMFDDQIKQLEEEIQNLSFK
jgi:DNA-directed RNA polymerase subunit N (RpoN/RPB10)